ncbi:MAG: DDE-type integrase/transposase/recombinase [Bacillota bacterium]|nr:DDE-type integrase/transposase/recombinase [Bacillota bacterium]
MDDHPTRIALFRYGLIAPLLAPDLEPGEKSALRTQILESEHLEPGEHKPRRFSARTLQRWLKDYREQGLAGLMPARRKDAGALKALDPAVLARAVDLRQEVPARSTRQIIDILMLDPETTVGPEDIKLSTLSRHLRRLGKTRALLRQPKGAFRRYEKDSPNAQWQSDVLYGPYLPDPADPSASSRRTYLVAFLDDHSRLVTHGAFYWAEDLTSLLDCFKRAILKRGLPVRVYCDRGVIYQSNQFQRICAELGVRHVAARPYAPEGKGKIERFWQNVDSSFLTELRARPAQTLEELQTLFGAWLEQGYHHWVNRETGETPSARFARSLGSIRLPDPVRVHEAFLWTEQRRVDKTACLSLQGNRYEVDPRLARLQVLLRYDPYDLSVVQIWHEDRRYSDAVPFELVRERDERVKPAPTRPAEIARTGLSYLNLLLDKHEREAGKALARIPFTKLEEDEPDV